MFKLQLARVEFRQVENVIEQLDQNLAGVMGTRQLLVLLGIQRAVQAQRQHPEQTIERGAYFMAHIGQKR